MPHLGQVRFNGAYRISDKQYERLRSMVVQCIRERKPSAQLEALQNQYLAKITGKPADEFSDMQFIPNDKGHLILTGPEAQQYEQLTQSAPPPSVEDRLRFIERMHAQAVDVGRSWWAGFLEGLKKPFRGIISFLTTPFRRFFHRK